MCIRDRSNPTESVPAEDVPVEEPAESNSVEEAPASSSSETPESTPVPEEEAASSSQDVYKRQVLCLRNRQTADPTKQNGERQLLPA